MDRPSRGRVRSFTGTRRDGELAPKAAVRATRSNTLGLTHRRAQGTIVSQRELPRNRTLARASPEEESPTGGQGSAKFQRACFYASPPSDDLASRGTCAR